MKLARTLVLAAALAALTGLSGTATAQDPEAPSDEGFQYYEAAARKILKSAGNKCWEAAEYAKRSNFFQFAHEQAKRAIKFDPNQKDAREYLGYVKRGKVWKLDEDEAEKLRKQNVRGGANGKQESQESFDKRVKDWKEKHLKKANEFVASRYAKLGDDCAKKGLPMQARKGYEASMRLNSENGKARKGLGYKKFGKVWLTAKQDKAREDAGKPVEVKEESARDGMFGETLIKSETVHFRVEAPLPIAELTEIAHALETAYAYYLADLGMDPTRDVFDGRRAVIVHMKDGEQWTAWCDASGASEFSRGLSGHGNTDQLLYGMRMKETSTPASRKDMSVHMAVHMLNRRVFKLQSSAWVDEGLAYYYNLKVHETSLTHCVAIKKGNYAKPGDEGGLKDWNDPANWKPNVRDLVQRKADVEMRALVQKPITQLEFEASIKAWSVIQWMMDTDRDTFIELVGDLGGRANHVATIEAQFEKNLEEIDKEWREYVLRNY